MASVDFAEVERSFCKVLQWADNAGDSTKFVEFMLGIIRDALKEISETNVAINVAVNVVTNKEKIIRHGANKNGYWEVIE